PRRRQAAHQGAPEAAADAVPEGALVPDRLRLRAGVVRRPALRAAAGAGARLPGVQAVRRAPAAAAHDRRGAAAVGAGPGDGARRRPRAAQEARARPAGRARGARPRGRLNRDSTALLPLLRRVLGYVRPHAGPLAAGTAL